MNKKLEQQLELIDSMALDYAMSPMNNALEKPLIKLITDILINDYQEFQYNEIDLANCNVQFDYKTNFLGTDHSFTLTCITFSNAGEDEIEVDQSDLMDIEIKVNEAFDEAAQDDYETRKTYENLR